MTEARPWARCNRPWRRTEAATPLIQRPQSQSNTGRSRRRRSPWRRLGLFTAAAALFLFSYYWGNQYRRPELSEVETAILLRPPQPLPEFHATDFTGQPLGRDRLRGHWRLLLIGTTDALATHRGLAQLNRIHNRLGEYPGLQETLRPLLISPDPEQDTLNRLRDTVHQYNPALSAAQGVETDLRELLAALSLPSSTEGIDPDHPTVLYLLDPEVRVLALFTADQDPAAVARDIRLILESAPGT